MGNNNKISYVKKFAAEFAFNDYIYDDDFFEFGGNLSSGSDDYHFQLGFTSKSLLKRIPS
jgi:hypothetical protein